MSIIIALRLRFCYYLRMMTFIANYPFLSILAAVSLVFMFLFPFSLREGFNPYLAAIFPVFYLAMVSYPLYVSYKLEDKIKVVDLKIKSKDYSLDDEKILASSPFDEVRLRVATNKKSSPEVLKTLIEDNNGFIATWAKANYASKVGVPLETSNLKTFALIAAFFTVILIIAALSVRLEDYLKDPRYFGVSILSAGAVIIFSFIFLTGPSSATNGEYPEDFYFEQRIINKNVSNAELKSWDQEGVRPWIFYKNVAFLDDEMIKYLYSRGYTHLNSEMEKRNLLIKKLEPINQTTTQMAEEL